MSQMSRFFGNIFSEIFDWVVAIFFLILWVGGWMLFFGAQGLGYAILSCPIPIYLSVVINKAWRTAREEPEKKKKKKKKSIDSLNQ